MLSAEHLKATKSRMHRLHERKMENSSRDIAAFLKMQSHLQLVEGFELSWCFIYKDIRTNHKSIIKI